MCCAHAQVPQIIIMAAFGKLNLVETASFLSILGFVFNVLFSLTSIIVKCVVGNRVDNRTFEIEITST